MEFLSTPWVPILASAAFVFLVSSVIHMVLPYHKLDYRALPDEEGLCDAMRATNLGPGNYMFPFCNSMDEMNSPEMLEKWNRGPVGFLTIFPNGRMRLGKCLLQWFLYSLLISVFVAYLTNLVHHAGTDFTTVFRTSGTIAVLAYATASIPESIWRGIRWATTSRFVLDGILVGLATGAAIGRLWPELA